MIIPEALFVADVWVDTGLKQKMKCFGSWLTSKIICLLFLAMLTFWKYLAVSPNIFSCFLHKHISKVSLKAAHQNVLTHFSPTAGSSGCELKINRVSKKLLPGSWQDSYLGQRPSLPSLAGSSGLAVLCHCPCRGSCTLAPPVQYAPVGQVAVQGNLWALWKLSSSDRTSPLSFYQGYLEDVFFPGKFFFLSWCGQLRENLDYNLPRREIIWDGTPWWGVGVGERRRSSLSKQIPRRKWPLSKVSRRKHTEKEHFWCSDLNNPGVWS